MFLQSFFPFFKLEKIYTLDMPSAKTWSILGGLTVLELAAQGSLLHASQSKARYPLGVITGMLLYAISGYVMYLLLTMKESVVFINLGWSIGALFVGAFLGFSVMHEKMTLAKIGALLLGIASLVLWEFGDEISLAKVKVN